MKLELRQELLSSISIDQLPPEYKAKELRDALDLMRKLSEHDVIELGSDHKNLAQEMLDSHIEWNNQKDCYYLSKASLLNDFNYNHLQYIAIAPKKQTISVRFATQFAKDNLEDLIGQDVEVIKKSKKSVICASDGTALLEAKGPFVKILARLEDEHYNLALDSVVKLITQIHEKDILMVVPNVSMNQYLLGFFLNITDYLDNRGQVNQVLTNFDLILNKGLQSVAMNKENVAADDFYHEAKKRECHVVKRDFTPRHIKYFFSDADKNLIIGFDADLDRPLIEKRLESPMQVAIDGGDWINREELEYDKITVLTLEDRAEERSLPGTKLLRHTQYASADLEYVRSKFEDTIRQKGSEKPLIRLKKNSLVIDPGLDDLEKSLAFEIANAVYDQLLLTTPLAARDKQKSYLRADERAVVKEVTKRARPYVEHVKGASIDYARIIAQRDMMKETFSELQKISGISAPIPLIEAAKRYKMNLITVLSAAKNDIIKTDNSGNVTVQEFENYVGGLEK